MEANVITKVLLPVALGIIMLGMGFGLTLRDFRRIFVEPRAVLIGLACQILLLPLVAYALLSVFSLEPALAVGVMIIAACPGGATSNLIANLAKGDVALSISLTAFSSAVTIISIPFVVNLAIEHLTDSAIVPLPVAKTILQVCTITLLPVLLGMGIKARWPAFAARGERGIRIFSGVFLALLILAAILKDRAIIIPSFQQAGPVTLALNLLTMALGFGLALVFGLQRKQRVTLAIEVGIQNGTLGILIATTLLENAQMAIPPAIYSLIMFMTALVLIWRGNVVARAAAQPTGG